MNSKQKTCCSANPSISKVTGCGTWQQNNQKSSINIVNLNKMTKIKKKVRVASSIALMCMLLFIGGCSNDTEVVNPEVKNATGQVSFTKLIVEYTPEEVIKEVRPVIQGFLDAQYEYALENDSDPQWDQYLDLTNPITVEKSKRLKTRMDEGLKNMQKIGDHYLSYTSKVSFDPKQESIYLEDGTWKIDYVIDQYTLATKDDSAKDGKSISRGGVTYFFSLKIVNGVWKINLWKDEPFQGAPDTRWFVQDWSLLIPSFNANLIQQKNLSARSGGYYSRKTAVRYAKDHWKNPNTAEYPDYSTYSGAADCTNFVSQCLEAGGWGKKIIYPNPKSNPGSWYHDKIGEGTRRSETWCYAGDFYDFLMQSNRVYSYTPNIDSIEIGDLVLWGLGNIHHASIVTSKKIVNNLVVPAVTYRNGGGYSPQEDVPIIYVREPLAVFKLKNSYGLA